MSDIPPPPPGFTLISDVAVPPPPPGFTLEGGQEPSRFYRAARFVDNVVRQTARGATLGFADEIAAGARSLGGENYTEALAQERDRDSAFQAENPITALGAQFVGGVLSPVSRVLPGGQAATMPQAIMRGAAGGAIAGGAAGFGEGEGGFLPRAISAAQGAALGGVVGGAVPVAVQGGVALARRASRALGLTSPQTNAQRIVLRDLERDGMTPEEMAANARQPGPTALADLGGENVLGTAAAVARQPGTGRQMAMDMVAGRGGEAQAERVAGRVREFIGAQNFRETADDLIARRRDAAAPAYERAWRIQLTPDEYSRVAPFVQDSIGQDALQRGLRIVELENLAARRPFNPQDYGVVRTQNGWAPAEGATPNMRLMDAVKRGYDAIIEDFRDDFGRLNLNEYGRAVNAVRAEYRNTLAGMFPPYRRALETWGGPSGTLEAMGVGRRLLDDGAAQAEMRAAQIARLPPGDREAFRIGVARGLLDRVEAATDAQELTRLNRVFGTPAIRQRLRAAFDSQEDFDRFAGEMRRELFIARSNQVLNPRAGSQTMPLQERAADIANPPPGPVGASVVRPDPNAPPSPLQALLMPQGGIFPAVRAVGQGLDRAAAIRDREALAPLLFATDPAARVRNAEALIARAQRDATLQRALTPTLQALARGGAVVAAPSD